MADLIHRGLFEDTLDDFFRGFFVRPVAYESKAAPRFRMDVAETENAYRVAADLPGVRKEDINVTIQADTVTVAAEVRAEKGAKDGEKILLAERYQGKIARTFTFDQEVDQTAAEANYHDGVLTLVLPKKAAATRRRVTVN
jgi:HSP20 family protein